MTACIMLSKSTKNRPPAAECESGKYYDVASCRGGPATQSQRKMSIMHSGTVLVTADSLVHG